MKSKPQSDEYRAFQSLLRRVIAVPKSETWQVTESMPIKGTKIINRRRARNVAITPEYHAIAADLVRAYAGEITVKQALITGGVAEKQAAKGWACVRERKGLNTAFQAALADHFAHEAAAPEPPPEMDVKLINKVLRQNLHAGKDRAVMSAKLLGSRKDLALWQPESLTGIVILEAPRSLPALPSETEPA